MLPIFHRTVSFLLLSLSCVTAPAHAMLMASVSCAGICTITPDDGNVAIPDPENFSLEVDWSPQHLALIEPDDDRGEWLFRLIFQITGGEPINSGGMGAIDLIDTSGVPIAELNVGIDDLSGAPITVNYEIFGPDTGSTFVARGFTLGPSSLNPDPTNPITGLEFVRAEISASQGGLEVGVKPVPIPGTVALFSLGVLVLGSRKARLGRQPHRASLPGS